MQVHLYSLRHTWSTLRRFSTKGVGGGGYFGRGKFRVSHWGRGFIHLRWRRGGGGADLGHCAGLSIFAWSSPPPPPRTPSTSEHHRTPRVWGAPNGKEAVGKGRRGKEHGRQGDAEEVVLRGARHGSPGPVHGRPRAGVPRGAQWGFWAWARVRARNGTERVDARAHGCRGRGGRGGGGGHILCGVLATFSNPLLTPFESTRAGGG